MAFNETLTVAMCCVSCVCSYIVGIRNLVDESGSMIKPSQAFTELRDNIPSSDWSELSSSVADEMMMMTMMMMMMMMMMRQMWRAVVACLVTSSVGCQLWACPDLISSWRGTSQLAAKRASLAQWCTCVMTVMTSR